MRPLYAEGATIGDGLMELHSIVHLEAVWSLEPADTGPLKLLLVPYIGQRSRTHDGPTG